MSGSVCISIAVKLYHSIGGKSNIFLIDFAYIFFELLKELIFRAARRPSSKKRGLFMTEERKTLTKDIPQNVYMENRESLKISGVNDVNCFNENIVEAATVLGKLVIRGEGIHIVKLDLNDKVLELSGYMYSCEYEDKSKAMRKGKFGGMFG